MTGMVVVMKNNQLRKLVQNVSIFNFQLMLRIVNQFGPRHRKSRAKNPLCYFRPVILRIFSSEWELIAPFQNLVFISLYDELNTQLKV